MIDDFWRRYINGLNLEQDLPDGYNPDDNEPEPETDNPDAQEMLNKQTAVLRFKLDIYVLSPLETKKAFMVNGKQTMEDEGVMPMKAALKLIQRRKNSGK